METETHTAGQDLATSTQLRHITRDRWLLNVGAQTVRLSTAELQAVTQLAYDVADLTPQLWTAAPASTELEATR